MAGSIAGAYLGNEKVPEKLVRHCEGKHTFTDLAAKLYKMCTSFTGARL
jgi:ADP-ribosylglycohydrolase